MQAGKGRRLNCHEQDFRKISLVPSSVLSPESLFWWRVPTTPSCIINDAVENSPQIRSPNHLAALGTGPPLGHRPASARSCVPGPEDSPTGPHRTRGSPRSRRKLSDPYQTSTGAPCIGNYLLCWQSALLLHPSYRYCYVKRSNRDGLKQVKDTWLDKELGLGAIVWTALERQWGARESEAFQLD